MDLVYHKLESRKFSVIEGGTWSPNSGSLILEIMNKFIYRGIISSNLLFIYLSPFLSFVEYNSSEKEKDKKVKTKKITIKILFIMINFNLKSLKKQFYLYN